MLLFLLKKNFKHNKDLINRRFLCLQWNKALFLNKISNKGKFKGKSVDNKWLKIYIHINCWIYSLLTKMPMYWNVDLLKIKKYPSLYPRNKKIGWISCLPRAGENNIGAPKMHNEYILFPRTKDADLETKF